MPHRLWLLLREPRVITAATAAMWGAVIGTGLGALISPPPSIEGEWGSTLTILWACLLLVGGSLGLAGCIPGWWWVERIGITATITGAMMHLSVLVLVHLSRPESYVVVIGFVAFAILALITRWLRIRGLQLDPAGGGPREPR